MSYDNGKINLPEANFRLPQHLVYEPILNIMWIIDFNLRWKNNLARV